MVYGITSHLVNLLATGILLDLWHDRQLAGYFILSSSSSVMSDQLALWSDKLQAAIQIFSSLCVCLATHEAAQNPNIIFLS